MKSRVVKAAINIIIFLFILTVISFVVRPIYDSVTEQLNDFEDNYIALLEEKIGIKIKYKSLSPSIFSAININGVEVYDVGSNAVILKSRKISLRYSIRKLLNKDLENAFTKLTINDVYFEYTDKSEFECFREHVRALTGYYEKDRSNRTEWLSQSFMDNLKKYLFIIPFDVQINNLEARYNKKTRYYALKFQNLSLNKKGENSTISVNTRGTARLKFGFTKGKIIGFNFNVSGKILKDLDGTTLMANVSDLKDCEYSVTNIDVLFRYNDMKVMALSESKNPNYSISGSLGLIDGQFMISMDTKNLKPDSLVHIREMNDVFYKAYDSLLSVRAVYKQSFINYAYKWSVDGDIDVSRSIIPSGEKLNVSIDGDRQVINASHVYASGDFLGGEFYGSYNIKTKEPSAALLIEHVTLPTNNNKASFDLYVDPFNDGIMGFIPELYLGEQVFTGLQLTLVPKNKNYDFTFEMNDFSHEEYETPGVISIDGSFVSGNNKYLEAYLNIDSMFIGSMLNAASFVLDKNGKNTFAKLVPSFDTFITSDEIYVSTDLKSITFNVPYGIVANTQKERQILIFSLDGNDESISVSQLSLLYGAITANASFDADYSIKDKQALFNTQCVINSIPYSFAGSFTDFKYLNLSGDYGTVISMELVNGVKGNLFMESFPFMVKDYLFSFSTDTSFLYNSKKKDYNVIINRFGFEELSGNLALMPKLDFTGNVSKDGFVISSVAYSDSSSALEGTGYLLWNYNNSVFDSISLNLDAFSVLSGEKLSVQVDMTNPDQQKFNLKKLISDWYFSAQVNLKEFPMGRFMSNQSIDDTLNATVYALGNMADPYVSIDIDSVSLQFASLPLIGKGKAELVNGLFNLQDFYINYTNRVIFDNVEANIDLTSFTGYAQTDLEVNLLKKQMTAPIKFTLDSMITEDTNGEWKGLTHLNIPEEFTVSVDCDQISGSLISESFPLHAMVSKIPDAFMLYSDDNLGVSGFYLSDGTVNLTIEDTKPLHLNVNGQIANKKLDLGISNLYLDASYFSYLINSSYLTIYNGTVNGDVKIEGLYNDPSFSGNIVVDSIDINLPDYIPDHLTGKELAITMEDSGFMINKTQLFVKSTPVYLSGYMYMDRWRIEKIEAAIKSMGSKGIPLNVQIPKISVKGNADIDMEAAYYDKTIDVSGSVKIDDTDIIALDNIRSASKNTSLSSGSKSSMDMRLNINLITGQQVRIVLKPVITGIIVPNTPINFIMDTANGMWSVKGEIGLKGGEVSYLSRSFYIKEGRVLLDENQNSLNPLITLRAETREKDSVGESVTIILSAVNQYLQNFKPILSSIPAKSENEIMSLLGQVITGDSDSFGNFIVAGVDYAAQLTILQSLNNSLRELMNFDIFSLRSTFIQQAIKKGLNMNENTSNNYSLSNLFDNTTVYIGKYFGSSVYADAQFRFVYNDSTTNIWGSNGTLQFQPELGLELEAPFANIRWNFSPDFETLQYSWATATSITLSWQFTF